MVVNQSNMSANNIVQLSDRVIMCNNLVNLGKFIERPDITQWLNTSQDLIAKLADMCGSPVIQTIATPVEFRGVYGHPTMLHSLCMWASPDVYLEMLPLISYLCGASNVKDARREDTLPRALVESTRCVEIDPKESISSTRCVERPKGIHLEEHNICRDRPRKVDVTRNTTRKVHLCSTSRVTPLKTREVEGSSRSVANTSDGYKCSRLVIVEDPQSESSIDDSDNISKWVEWSGIMMLNWPNRVTLCQQLDRYRVHCVVDNIAIEFGYSAKDRVQDRTQRIIESYPFIVRLSGSAKYDSMAMKFIMDYVHDLPERSILYVNYTEEELSSFDDNDLNSFQGKPINLFSI